MTVPNGFNRQEWTDICGEATALLQDLLRIDTTNPPGDEVKAARFLAETLEQDGLSTEIIESAPGRANLICRLEAKESSGPPLLLAGHLDVVPPGDVGRWTHEPFGGELDQGYIWGRGAVDMKNMVAMSAMVVRLLKRRGVSLGRDVIFAAVADEEAGCTHGSRFLVEQHPEKVRAGFALGELGGFNLSIKGARVCPVQTAEKGKAWLKVTAKGPSGHGSMPLNDSTVVRLSEALARIGKGVLPQHNTPVAEAFIRGLADLLPYPDRAVLPRLLWERASGVIISSLIKDPSQARNFNAMLHNTAAPTVVRAGEAPNIIPDRAEAELDGRLLPEQTAQDLIDELKVLVEDDELTFEVLRESKGVMNHPPGSPLWATILEVMGKRDPTLKVLPYMIPGYTDGAWFSRLGARWYGFSPIKLDTQTGPAFAELFHGIDERIPEDGFHWGLGALWEVVSSFAGAIN